MNTLSVFTLQFSFCAISALILYRGNLQSQAKERLSAAGRQNTPRAVGKAAQPQKVF